MAPHVPGRLGRQYVVDEAGDPTLFGRRRKVVVGPFLTEVFPRRKGSVAEAHAFLHEGARAARRVLAEGVGQVPPRARSEGANIVSHD